MVNTVLDRKNEYIFVKDRSDKVSGVRAPHSDSDVRQCPVTRG
jgi:hypothetical protein